MCVCERVCMCLVLHTCVQAFSEARGVRSPGTGVVGICELSCRCWESNPYTWKEQASAAGPSCQLRLLKVFLKVKIRILVFIVGLMGKSEPGDLELAEAGCSLPGLFSLEELCCLRHHWAN